MDAARNSRSLPAFNTLKTQGYYRFPSFLLLLLLLLLKGAFFEKAHLITDDRRWTQKKKQRGIMNFHFFSTASARFIIIFFEVVFSFPRLGKQQQKKTASTADAVTVPTDEGNEGAEGVVLPGFFYRVLFLFFLFFFVGYYRFHLQEQRCAEPERGQFAGQVTDQSLPAFVLTNQAAPNGQRPFGRSGVLAVCRNHK